MSVKYILYNPLSCNGKGTELAQSFARMRNQKSKHDVQGCTIAVAQSRRKDAPTPTTAIRQPRYTFARSTSGVLFLVLGEGEHATCG